MLRCDARTIILLLVCLIPLTSTMVGVRSGATGIGITFNQVDFVFTCANVPNSDWGHIDVNVSEFTAYLGLSEGYLNIYTDSGWVVQNQLIDSVTGMDTITIYFDLGVPIGTHVTLLSGRLEFTSEPYVTFGDGVRSDYPVGTVEYNAEGVGASNVTAIPSPMPRLEFNVTGLTYAFTKPEKEGENVQTAKRQCVPMSIANSLQYLKDQYGIAVPHNHKPGLKDDNSLVGQLDSACGRNAPSRTKGDGVAFDDMLKGKFKYLSDNGLADALVHKHQGYGFGYDEKNKRFVYGSGTGSLPAGDFTANGITSKDESVNGQVTFEWIEKQLRKCEDVEIVYAIENSTTGEIVGGHAVRVFGCGKTKGVPWLRYKHDRLQTDPKFDPHDTVGLEEPEVELKLGCDGMLTFGSPNKKICFALAESPSPKIPVGGYSVSINLDGSLAPHIGLTSAILLAIVATFVYVKRVKRRKEKE